MSATLTDAQKREIERLASLLATARVIRARYRLGDYNVPGLTPGKCQGRIDRAGEALRAYLDSL